MAADSLAKGETQACIIAGTQANLSPWAFVIIVSDASIVTRWMCKTFDAGADGYGRGEGVGVVVAMRLADAMKQGRQVLAVMQGSAVNHDGRSSGFTAPNGPAQEAVYNAALKQSRSESEGMCK